MEQQAPAKTSSHVRIGLYEEMQRELFTKLKQKEKELKTLLAELEATRSLLDEAMHDAQEEDEIKLTQEKQSTIDKEIQSLESMTKAVTEELISRNETPYQSITSQELRMATGYDARKDLFNLMYKSNWSDDDAKTFFAISDAHRVANEYNFNPLVKENLAQTYNVIQQVVARQEEQIKTMYQPTLLRPAEFSLEKTLAGVQLPKTASLAPTPYQKSERASYTSSTPKILDILKKK